MNDAQSLAPMKGIRVLAEAFPSAVVIPANEEADFLVGHEFWHVFPDIFNPRSRFLMHGNVMKNGFRLLHDIPRSHFRGIRKRMLIVSLRSNATGLAPNPSRWLHRKSLSPRADSGIELPSERTAPFRSLRSSSMRVMLGMVPVIFTTLTGTIGGMHSEHLDNLVPVGLVLPGNVAGRIHGTDASHFHVIDDYHPWPFNGLGVNPPVPFLNSDLHDNPLSPRDKTAWISGLQPDAFPLYEMPPTDNH